MKRLAVCLLALLTLLSFGCKARNSGSGTSSGGSESSSSTSKPGRLGDGGYILEQLGADFSSMDERDYSRASRKLGRLIDIDLDSEEGNRAIGPRLVAPGAHGAGTLVAVTKSETGTALVLAHVDGKGDIRWVKTLPVAQGSLVGTISVAKHEGVNDGLIRVALSGRQLDAIYLALQPFGPVVVRAERGGAVANRQLGEAQPGMPIMPGSIGASDKTARLAASVYLSKPGVGEERNKPANRTHIEALAGGNDLWLAEAAATLLTLPD